jgi:hypothetical protein
MTEIQILIELAQQNATHIEILNREMGGVLAELAMIKWLIGGLFLAVASAFITIVFRKIFKK